MKCKGCGEEFANLNALTKHKSDCPGEELDGPEQISGDSEADCLIPIYMCPEEIKLFAIGHTVGLRVEGRLAPDGVVVQEVKFIR